MEMAMKKKTFGVVRWEFKGFFCNVGPPKESIFFTTIYVLYFSHHYTLDLHITFLHVKDLCGQLSCTAIIQTLFPSLSYVTLFQSFVRLVSPVVTVSGFECFCSGFYKLLLWIKRIFKICCQIWTVDTWFARRWWWPFDHDDPPCDERV